MAKKVKMPDNVLRFFRETGSEGGRARAEKHTKEELREWGKKGWSAAVFATIMFLPDTDAMQANRAPSKVTGLVWN